jgi:pyruvate formate lyase activating enzyme
MLSQIARYWHVLDASNPGDGRVVCDLCPHCCTLKPGQRGLCYGRVNEAGSLVLDIYGRITGLAVDPIEKKPLYHFLPGSSILSFGTIGCNLSCSFCQNWDISATRSEDRLSMPADPQRLADIAEREGCAGIACTYNEPVIFLEFACEVAKACRARGLRTAAVTAGYISEHAMRDFFDHFDAVNIDLKSFSDAFYKRLCGVRIDAVLDTIRYVARETNTWLELTTLLIPGENDSDAELHRLCSWIVENTGTDTPVHFSAFHPAWKLRDKYATPRSTLARAREIASSHGLHYAYTGNVHDPDGSATRCRSCGAVLIEREGYSAKMRNLRGGVCTVCGTRCAGIFE